LIVRAAVAFFRGACDFLFAVDFFFAVDDEELFVLFLVVDDALLGDELDDDPEVCAGDPLPCNSNSTARLDAVKRLRNIGGLSLTRLADKSVLPEL
jgi:hypothetical protein